MACNAELTNWIDSMPAISSFELQGRIPPPRLVCVNSSVVLRFLCMGLPHHALPYTTMHEFMIEVSPAVVWNESKSTVHRFPKAKMHQLLLSLPKRRLWSVLKSIIQRTITDFPKHIYFGHVASRRVDFGVDRVWVGPSPRLPISISPPQTLLLPLP